MAHRHEVAGVKWGAPCLQRDDVIGCRPPGMDRMPAAHDPPTLRTAPTISSRDHRLAYRLPLASTTNLVGREPPPAHLYQPRHGDVLCVMRLATLTAAALIAATTLTACSSGPDADCRSVPSSVVVDLAKGLTAADVDSAATYDADGGTYVVGRLGSKDATVVWFQTPAGTTYSVGAVTALFSNFPDSAAHTQAGVGTDGYDTAKGCVE